MAAGKTRHMFAGGNKAEGFFSYYDNILPQEKAERYELPFHPMRNHEAYL